MTLAPEKSPSHLLQPGSEHVLNIRTAELVDGKPRGDLKVVKLDGPASRRLADLLAIRRDLGYAVECCKRLVQIMDSEKDLDVVGDSIGAQALWTAAVIAYSRCFAEGRRQGLADTVVEGLEGDPVGYHRTIINFRNKHIAHSVNPFGDMHVGAAPSPDEPEARGVAGIMSFGKTHQFADRAGVEGLWTLAGQTYNHVSGLPTELLEEVWQEARAIPIDDLYARPPISTVVHDVDQVDKPRP